MIEDSGKQQRLVHLIIGILVFGSIWGFFEATLGGFLHMIIFPNKGAIMGGIGVALMATALAIFLDTNPAGHNTWLPSLSSHEIFFRGILQFNRLARFLSQCNANWLGSQALPVAKSPTDVRSHPGYLALWDTKNFGGLSPKWESVLSGRPDS
ncbi:unnamed protein product [marine sediment metagenome]|uniref:Uncharacterized protein n=1 Tax=marine sediment metagenome TaxID=412755 RepID=X1GYV0_9ZZZZ